MKKQMTDADVIAYCGDDVRKWAECFKDTGVKMANLASDTDEAWLASWFANAIETAIQVRSERLARSNA